MKEDGNFCNFGEHLMIDGYRGNRNKLNDKKIVAEAFEETVKLCEMKKLAEPVIYFAQPNHIKDPGGWSGYVVIQESHISIHTFPARAFVSIDVYTCKNGLKKEEICAFFKDTFELEDLEVNFVKRGTRYPVADVVE